MTEYAVPLLLTTPHMTGTAVRDAQFLMAGNSRFPGLATYKDGKPDGDYGPVTAAATKRAKFWVGYPLSACDEVFGQVLYEYLRPEKWRPLPDDYRKRRAERLAAAAETVGMKALKFAVGEIGYKETYRNRTKYGRDYGFDGVPWCAIFETYSFKHTGWANYRYAAVEAIYYDAVNGRNKLRIVRTPQRGDIACYSLHGERFAHTAFYVEPHADGSFRDLGGNTGPVDISNGGMVAYGERTMSQVLAFVRVG